MDNELIAVLALYPSVTRPLSPPESLGNAGGMSGSRLWRYRAGLGPLVVRAWPQDGPACSVLTAIHGWLSETRQLGFVPVPLSGTDGRTFYEVADRYWEMAPWMSGRAGIDRPPSERRVSAGFGALAAFHQRLASHQTFGTSPGLKSRLREVDGLLGGGFARLLRILENRPTDPLSRLARQWVELAQVEAPSVHAVLSRSLGSVVATQPCLRDARPEHFLFTEDRVTGLVDFGAMGLDVVAGDLARLASEWVGRDRALRAVGIDSYNAVRPLSPEETALIDVFDCSASLLGAGHWARWHFLEGRTFEDPTTVARGLEKGIDRLRARRTG